MEPQQTNTIPVAPQSKPNHKIFYILIFVFIAVVGSSAYLFLQNPKKEVTQSVPIQNRVEEWKTYLNEEYGFEFKYPVTNNPYIKDIVTYPEGDFGGRLLALEVGSNDDGLHTAVAFVLVTDNSVTELSDFQDTKRYKKIIDEELMTNGVLWKLVEYEILYPADINFTRIASYKSKNYTYSISTAYDREKFNKILSTFKFISEKYKVVDDSLLNDRKLIEINSDGSEKIIIPSFKAIAPGESYHYFEKLSFPKNSNNLYFYTFLDGTDAPPGGVYSYNLLTKELKKLPNVSEYYSNYGDKFLSPNGKYLATIVNPHQYSNKQIFLLDLEHDMVTPIVTLTGKESITFCSVSGDCWDNQGDIKWINNNTIEYKIYDSSYFGEQTIYDYPEMDKRRFAF